MMKTTHLPKLASPGPLALLTLVAAVAFTASMTVAMDETPTACAAGFTEAGSTRSELTCVKTERVASVDEADATVEKLQHRQGCSGEVTEQKASIADGISGEWLVTMLFSCANDD